VGVEVGLRRMLERQRAMIVIPASSPLLLFGREAREAVGREGGEGKVDAGRGGMADELTDRRCVNVSAGAGDQSKRDNITDAHGDAGVTDDLAHVFASLGLPTGGARVGRGEGVAGGRVVFDVVVLRVLNHPWDKSEGGAGGVERKMEMASQRKVQGTQLLRKGFSRLAALKYQAAQELLEYEETEEPDTLLEQSTLELHRVSTGLRARLLDLKVALLLNLAACLHREHHRPATECGIQCCEAALELRPQSALALLRKGTLHLELGQPEEAHRDLKAASQQCPGDAQIAGKLARAQRALDEGRHRDRRLWGSIFQK